MDELTIRTPSDEDLESILDLLSLGLGTGTAPRTRAFWTWKHLASPFGPSYLLVAVSGGKIVGLRAFMRWTWWSSEEPIPAVRAVDTVTHPDWRGRGLFQRLTLEMVEQLQSERIAFVFNTPNPKSMPGYLKMGWVKVGRLTPWLLPRRPRRFLRSRPETAVDGPEGGFPTVHDLVGVQELDALLLATRGDDRRLATRPDRPYLLWRYARAPGLRYHAAWHPDGDQGAAIVFRLAARKRGVELRLCEVLVGPHRRAIHHARRLIDTTARRASADFVTALAAPATPERRVVLGRGFLPLPHGGPVLTVRPLDPDATPLDPRSLPNWRPVIGALELF